MKEKELTNFFEDYLKKDPLFKDKKALQSNYTPKNVPYRDEEIEQLRGILAPALRMEKPSNIFIYGKTGTGKTLITNYIINQLIEFADSKNIPIKFLYLNCKMKGVADTEYRILVEFNRVFNVEVPKTGLPVNEIYSTFINNLEKENILLLIILDEIDQLVNKAGDEILYNLSRINSELKNSQISLIGISNDLRFVDNLDPRIKSSLSEEEMLFHPYNAIQLQKILQQRAELAFRKDVLEEGVINKCSAYAAREHGDARRALDLLRVAGEIAERKNNSKILINHIDEAEEKIDRDRIVDYITTQPKQVQVILYSILEICDFFEDKSIFTGDIYEKYKELCSEIKLKPLTQRRISDIIAELDMHGIINAKIIYKGRYGKTREISVTLPKSQKEQIKNFLSEVI